MHNSHPVSPGQRLMQQPLLRGGFAIMLGCTIVSAAADAALLGGTRFAFKVKPDAAPAAAKTDINRIDHSMLDSVVEIQGTIKTISPPREGSKQPYKIKVADETGAITVIIWQNIFEVVKSQYNLAPGDAIRVRAPVSEFRNEVQLTLKNASDLGVRPQSGPPGGSATSGGGQAATTPLASINQSLVGQELTIQAAITDVREPSSEKAPFVVTLTQGEARVPMVFWKDLQERIADKIRVGNVVRAKVQVNQHRDTLQVKLLNAGDIEVVGTASEGGAVAATDPQTEASPRTEGSGGTMNIAAITEASADSTVTITGKISTSDNIGKGQQLRVRDDSGEIQVILWDNVLSQVPVDNLQAGRTMTVTGRVKLYRGKLEIVPDSAQGVTVQSN